MKILVIDQQGESREYFGIVPLPNGDLAAMRGRMILFMDAAGMHVFPQDRTTLHIAPESDEEVARMPDIMFSDEEESR